MRIVIADDHPVVLIGLRALLEQGENDYVVVGEAHSGKALLDLLARCPCDLVITDFSMPTEGGAADGLYLIRSIRRQYPNLPILILTMLNNLALIRGMLDAGARAVVEKTAMTRELVSAIRTISSHGQVYVSDELRRRLGVHGPVGHFRASDTIPALSVREAEIMRLLARGLTVTEIARMTNRSIKTVSQQKHDAMRKLGITTDNELFEYMRSHGL